MVKVYPEYRCLLWVDEIVFACVDEYTSSQTWGDPLPNPKPIAFLKPSPPHLSLPLSQIWWLWNLQSCLYQTSTCHSSSMLRGIPLQLQTACPLALASERGACNERHVGHWRNWGVQHIQIAMDRRPMMFVQRWPATRFHLYQKQMWCRRVFDKQDATTSGRDCLWVRLFLPFCSVACQILRREEHKRDSNRCQGAEDLWFVASATRIAIAKSHKKPSCWWAKLHFQPQLSERFLKNWGRSHTAEERLGCWRMRG